MKPRQPKQKRKRKRNPRQDSKPAQQVVVQPETERPASPVEIQLEIKNSVSPNEIRDETENPASPFPTSPDAEEPAPDSATPTGDRRSHPRYAFTAAVEVVAAESGARVKTRVRDLSEQGCYVDADSPLALGTATDVRITKGTKSFAARARVVYSQVSKGMGLVFTAIAPEQRVTLETWVAETRETSWLASNRRRSQRVLMKIPVRVSGQNALGSPFEEETQTLAVSAHGALILVSTQVKKGQRLTLSNVPTKAALECVVAHIPQRDDRQVGVEFIMPSPMFWHVAFPPKDWTPRHPHAKPRFQN